MPRAFPTLFPTHTHTTMPAAALASRTLAGVATTAGPRPAAAPALAPASLTGRRPAVGPAASSAPRPAGRPSLATAAAASDTLPAGYAT